MLKLHPYPVRHTKTACHHLDTETLGDQWFAERKTSRQYNRSFRH